MLDLFPTPLEIISVIFIGHSFESTHLHDQFKNTKKKLHSKTTITKIRRGLEKREEVFETYVRNDSYSTSERQRPEEEMSRLKQMILKYIPFTLKYTKKWSISLISKLYTNFNLL